MQNHAFSSPRRLAAGGGVAALSLALVLIGTSLAPASAATLDVPASSPAVDASTSVDVEGTIVIYSGRDLTPGAGAESLLPDIIRLRTEGGQSVLIDGALTDGVVSGSTFVGTLAIPTGDAPEIAEAVRLELPDAELSEAPVESTSDLGQEILAAAESLETTLTVTAGSITAPLAAALVAPLAHTVDVAIVTEVGGEIVVADSVVSTLLQTLGGYWATQSAGQVASIAKPLPIRRLVDADTCDPDLAWEVAATAFGDPSQDSYFADTGRHLMVIVPDYCGDGIGWGTVGTLNSGGVIWGTYVDYAATELLGHEFGHNFGLSHSNGHFCPDMTVEGADLGNGTFSNGCFDEEYFDPYDIMGATFSTPALFNAQLTALNVTQKSLLGALSPSELPTVTSAVGTGTSTGTSTGASTQSFAVSPASATSGLRGLRVIDPRTGEAYFIEYRSGTGIDAGSIYASPQTIPTLHTGVRVLRLRADTSSAVLTVPNSAGVGARHFALRASESLAMASGGLSISVTGLGATAAVTLTFGAWKPSVDRLWGDDRYTTAVSISKAAYPGSAAVVYIATGENYPDALGAAPAATKEGGPLLLVQPGKLPDVVATEIRRLKPGKIVVVGGPNAVSDVALTQIKALVPNTIRLSGADRFETSRLVVGHAFPGAVGAAYVATGLNFPDALSASAAAGAAGIPVVLVDGGAASVDSATTAMLAARTITSLTIVGGPNAVSDGISRSLSAVGTVARISGTDRFDTSQKLNKAAFSSANRVYLATGLAFPDALAGAALAGARKSPLYVVQPGCIPPAIRADLVAFSAPAVTLLGGPNALSDNVAALKGC